MPERRPTSSTRRGATRAGLRARGLRRVEILRRREQHARAAAAEDRADLRRACRPCRAGRRRRRSTACRDRRAIQRASLSARMATRSPGADARAASQAATRAGLVRSGSHTSSSATSAARAAARSRAGRRTGRPYPTMRVAEVRHGRWMTRHEAFHNENVSKEFLMPRMLCGFRRVPRARGRRRRQRSRPPWN